MSILAAASSPPGREKLLQQLRSIIGQDATGDLGMMIEPGFGKQVHYTAAGSRFGIGCSINHARNAGMNDGSGAHGARFDGHVQLAIAESVVTHMLRSIAQRDDFGMRRGIVARNRLVEAPPDHLPCADHHRADWNFTCGGRFPRKLKGFAHEGFVAHLDSAGLPTCS